MSILRADQPIRAIFAEIINHPGSLFDLLRKGKLWTLRKEQRKAFELSKSALQSTNLLVHFDSEKELTLACDASSHGVGAVLSHRHADDTGKPIAFASRTLTQAERGYAQLDKKAMAVMFGVKRFHQFI